MPARKNPVKFYLSDEEMEKMRYVAKKETRSLSNLIGHLCQLYVENFEKENGKIQIETILEP